MFTSIVSARLTAGRGDDGVGGGGTETNGATGLGGAVMGAGTARLGAVAVLGEGTVGGTEIKDVGSGAMFGGTVIGAESEDGGVGEASFSGMRIKTRSSFDLRFEIEEVVVFRVVVLSEGEADVLLSLSC